MFPLFASRFLKRDEDVPSQTSEVPRYTDANSSGTRLTNTNAKPSSLNVLDLQTLPRDDGPPTETRAKKEKLAHYERLCSHVGDRLYVGGEVVAKSLSILQESKITHIVNCVGFLYPAYFEKHFSYQTLYLQDSPSEDIISVLYDVFDFIGSASSATDDGRVFVHCSQGVSRSTTLAIAYRMWKEDRTFEDVFAEVKQLRGITNPNIGFICQLLQWYKRRHEEALAPRLYRIAPQSPSVPLYLVPKSASILDPRGAFVLHSGDQLWVWTGGKSPEAFHTAALQFAGQLHRYEGAPAIPTCINQGKETEEFWDLIESVVAAVSKGVGTPPAVAPGSRGPRDIRNVPAYDRDYDLYARAINPGTDDTSPLDSARSGRKTPRSEIPHAASPNDRFRKQARNEAIERERSSRSSGNSYNVGSESARNRALDFQELSVRRRAPKVSTPRSGALQEHLPPTNNNNYSRGPSRLGIPKLAIPNTNGGGGGGDDYNGKTVEDSSLSEVITTSEEEDDGPSSASSLLDDDDGDITSDDGNVDDDDDDDDGNNDEEKEERKSPPSRMVPRLNLGR